MSRRRKQKEEINVPVVAAIIVAVTVITYQQHMAQWFMLFLIIILLGLALGAVFLYIRYRAHIRLKDSNITEVDAMPPLQFEEYVKVLLENSGYNNVRLTEYYDLGIDVVAHKDNVGWGVQVKHYKGAVGLDAVREAVAALAHYNCERAMVITNSYYTKPAQTIAASTNCILIDRDALINMILAAKTSKR